MDCGIANSYVVKLDEELSLISAWNPTNPVLSFHALNALQFTQTLYDTGLCSAEPVPTPTPNVDPACTTTLTDEGTISVFYDQTNDLVNIEATLVDGSYAGWGWGSSMTETEMVIFSASADSSSALTYYSTTEQPPTLEDTLQACYTTSYTVNADGTIFFKATRPLDCGVANSYVVKLGEELSLISAWNPTNPVLSFHSLNALQFTQTLYDTGLCSLPGPTPNVDPACTNALKDEGSISVFYDQTNELVNIEATLVDGSYAGWGWGSSMKETEMVIFSANADSSSALTYYSKTTEPPTLDDTLQACYTTSYTVNADSTIFFKATRPLDCGVANSYVVKLDEELSLISAWNPKNPVLSFHTLNYLEFTQTLFTTGLCSAEPEPTPVSNDCA